VTGSFEVSMAARMPRHRDIRITRPLENSEYVRRTSCEFALPYAVSIQNLKHRGEVEYITVERELGGVLRLKLRSPRKGVFICSWRIDMPKILSKTKHIIHIIIFIDF